MEVKANFQVLQELADLIKVTGNRIAGEKDAWGTKSKQTEADWLDTAGGAFGGVSNAWSGLIEVQEEVLRRLDVAVQDAIRIYMEAKARAQAQVESTSLGAR
jgi:hypothetical protein